MNLKDLYSESLVHWQNYHAQFLAHVPPHWQGWNKSDLDWTQTFCIDEVPAGDQWQSPSTDLLLWQDSLYRTWGYNKATTEHFMCFDLGNVFQTEKIAAQFVPRPSPYTCSLLRIPVGMTIPWHSDTYAYFVKQHGVPQHQIKQVVRAAVFLEDWQPGHVVQIGGDIVAGWKAGDVWAWDHEAWHGACNFGTADFTIMQVTYIKSTLDIVE